MPQAELSNEKRQNPKTPGLSSDFYALEEEILRPKNINEKFDLLLDPIRRVPEAEKIFFTQNLGVMIKSGLSASRALQTLTLQTTNPKLKRALFSITKTVEKGGTLADALGNYPKIFSPIFVNMIKAGETSGQLENVLKELTHQIKKSHELKNKVKGALMYPTAILVSMVGIGTGMLVFVIPKLLDVFSEMNVELPLPTRVLISLSNVINGYILFIAPLAAAAAVFLIYATRRGSGQKIWHFLILKTPIVKTIAMKINLARLARTLSSLLNTEMPIVDSIKLTSDVLKNVYYRQSLMNAAAQVETGQPLSRQLAKNAKLFPPVTVQMIQVGEETGEISSILKQLAEFYEEEVEQTMESLPSLIEPVLIVILGGAVGGMAVAVILPMYSLTNAV